MTQARSDENLQNRKNETVVVAERKARQGLLGMPVLVVLVFGLFLASVVWVLVEYSGADGPSQSMRTAAPPASNAQNADGTDAPTIPGPAPVDRDPTPDTGTGGP